MVGCLSQHHTELRVPPAATSKHGVDGFGCQLFCRPEPVMWCGNRSFTRQPKQGCVWLARPAGSVSHSPATQHRSMGNKMLSASLRKMLCDAQFVYSAQKIAVEVAEQLFLSCMRAKLGKYVCNTSIYSRYKSFHWRYQVLSCCAHNSYCFSVVHKTDRDSGHRSAAPFASRPGNSCAPSNPLENREVIHAPSAERRRQISGARAIRRCQNFNACGSGDH
jgi:hypothetical protein